MLTIDEKSVCRKESFAKTMQNNAKNICENAVLSYLQDVPQKHTNRYAKVRFFEPNFEILVVARILRSRFTACFGFEKF